MSKCARIFLTRALGVADVDLRGHGRVLEDGNITYRGNIRRNCVSGLVRFEEMCWKLTLDVRFEEMCWKLTLDAAVVGVKHRQRLAIGQDADIA